MAQVSEYLLEYIKQQIRSAQYENRPDVERSLMERYILIQNAIKRQGFPDVYKRMYETNLPDIHYGIQDKFSWPILRAKYSANQTRQEYVEALQFSGVRVGIIIQARMTSKRFPGKTLELLGTKRVIEHVIDNCLKVPNTLVIVAIPNEKESEVISSFINAESKYTTDNLQIYAGAKDNVLARYYWAAKEYNLDVIVRITGDCPFVDSYLIEECVLALRENNAGYASNVHPDRTFAKGLDVEAFPMTTLEQAYEAVGKSTLEKDKYAQEHVTNWMQHSPKIKKAHILSETDFHNENYCIDYPEDIKRLAKYAQ